MLKAFLAYIIWLLFGFLYLIFSNMQNEWERERWLRLIFFSFCIGIRQPVNHFPFFPSPSWHSLGQVWDVKGSCLPLDLLLPWAEWIVPQEPPCNRALRCVGELSLPKTTKKVETTFIQFAFLIWFLNTLAIVYLEAEGRLNGRFICLGKM